MFIVIEGIDGAGCETQAKLVTQKLIESGSKATLIKYPHYDDDIGKMIRSFLYDNKDFSAKEQFLLYSLQFIHDAPTYPLTPNSYLIADRYFSTTLCYQTLAGVDLQKAINFANDFGIEKPDVIFYLDVDPDIAIKRKAGEDKEKNRNEKDFDLIRKTSKQYQMLIDKQVWTKWIKIDGNKSIEQITKDIYNKITYD